MDLIKDLYAAARQLSKSMLVVPKSIGTYSLLVDKILKRFRVRNFRNPFYANSPDRSERMNNNLSFIHWMVITIFCESEISGREQTQVSWR